MAESRNGDPDAGPADARMAAYLEGQHHPQQALAPRVAYLATVDGVTAGYIAGHLTRRYVCDGEVQYLYVAEPFRRSGIASMLLRQLAKWFEVQGAARICVDVNEQSPGARPFYLYHGAQPLRPHWLVWPDIGSVLGGQPIDSGAQPAALCVPFPAFCADGAPNPDRPADILLAYRHRTAGGKP